MGYYGRWEKSGDVWKIAVQVQVGDVTPLPPTPPPPVPPVDASCAAHTACSELEGNCCPTDAGVTLDCCGAALCSAHAECRSLGLAGHCCPDDFGLRLDCCGSSTV